MLQRQSKGRPEAGNFGKAPGSEKRKHWAWGMTVKELTGFLEQEDTAAAGQKEDQSPGQRNERKHDRTEKCEQNPLTGLKALKNVSVTSPGRRGFRADRDKRRGQKYAAAPGVRVFKPDDGLAIVDNMPVYDNVHAKAKLFFIADEPYFFNGATPKDMERYYSSVYRNFDRERFYLYLNSFGLESRRRISTFSKGMKSSSRFCWG